MNYTTGRNEAWKAKNIYDIAGNVREWTLEKTTNSDSPCSGRGGNYNNDGSNNPASCRNYGTTSGSDYRIGFRPALY